MHCVFHVRHNFVECRVAHDPPQYIPNTSLFLCTSAAQARTDGLTDAKRGRATHRRCDCGRPLRGVARRHQLRRSPRTLFKEPGDLRPVLLGGRVRAHAAQTRRQPAKRAADRIVAHGAERAASQRGRRRDLPEMRFCFSKRQGGARLFGHVGLLRLLPAARKKGRDSHGAHQTETERAAVSLQKARPWLRRVQIVLRGLSRRRRCAAQPELARVSKRTGQITARRSLCSPIHLRSLFGKHSVRPRKRIGNPLRAGSVRSGLRNRRVTRRHRLVSEVGNRLGSRQRADSRQRLAAQPERPAPQRTERTKQGQNRLFLELEVIQAGNRLSHVETGLLEHERVIKTAVHNAILAKVFCSTYRSRSLFAPHNRRRRQSGA